MSRSEHSRMTAAERLERAKPRRQRHDRNRSRERAWVREVEGESVLRMTRRPQVRHAAYIEAVAA